MYLLKKNLKLLCVGLPLNSAYHSLRATALMYALCIFLNCILLIIIVNLNNI